MRHRKTQKFFFQEFLILCGCCGPLLGQSAAPAVEWRGFYGPKTQNFHNPQPITEKVCSGVGIFNSATNTNTKLRLCISKPRTRLFVKNKIWHQLNNGNALSGGR